MTNIETGSFGEKLATVYLQKLGFEFIEANYHSKRWGEIDLVFKDGDSLVFVEVKTRRSFKYGKPEDAVSYHKLRKLRRSINYYVYKKKVKLSLRVDVVTVMLKADVPPKIEHFRNVMSN